VFGAVEALDERRLFWDGHLLLIHHTEQERRSVVSAWVRQGLRRDAKVVYVEPAGSSADRSLSSILESHPVPLAREAMAIGQIQVVEPDADFYSEAGQRRLLDEALADGYSSIRVSGEVETALDVVTAGVHDDVEHAMDQLCRSAPVSALCQCPAELPADHLRTVFDAHAGGIRAGRMHVRVGVSEVRLAGEADVCSAQAMTWALCSALRGGCGATLRVDLSGLTFLDVAGFEAILSGTADFRRAGGCVLLRGAYGPVRRLLELVGVDDRQGLEADR
jgi:anti-anti-sigma factor